jgi:hypothetical protein
MAGRREEIIALSHVMARAYPDAYAVKLGHDEMHLMRENFRPLILLEHV